MVWTLIIVLLLAINPVPSAENPSSRARFLFLLSSLLALPKGRCALHGALLSPGRDRVNPAVSALLLLAANVAASDAPVVALLQSLRLLRILFHLSALDSPLPPSALYALARAATARGGAVVPPCCLRQSECCFVWVLRLPPLLAMRQVEGR